MRTERENSEPREREGEREGERGERGGGGGMTLNIGWWMLRLAYCTFCFSSCSPCRAEGAVLKRVEGSGRRDWLGVRVQGPPQAASLTLPARGVRAEGLGLRVQDS